MKKTLFVSALSLLLFSCGGNKESKEFAIKSIKEENFDLTAEGQKGAKNNAVNFDNLQAFNEAGNITQKRLFNPDGSAAGTYIYEYNAKNLLIKETKYTPTENIDKVYTYSYNSDNQLETQTTHSALGNIQFADKFTYPSPTLTVQECSDAQGGIIDKYQYEYDQNHNLIKQTWFALGNAVVKTFIYNDKNLLTEQTENDSNGYTTKWQFEYDEQGNEVSQTVTYSDGTQNKTVSKYEYDKYNNWIIKQIYGNGTPLYQIERTIEYY
ncbi:MAG: RHS repeat protein [Prevotellaceae bacterium]|jgi:YD repeat-containing protein|nr:RHS repeat protein [Prevotellaceae bacterium]